jgi:NADH:ubiquinone oxidoreductase subunit K
MLPKIRLAAAVIILLSIFLPISECQRRDNAIPKPKSFSQQLFPQSNADFEYQYGYRQIGFTLVGILTIVAFGWPLACLLLLERRRRILRFLLPIEILLCAGTLYWVHAISFGGRYLYGACVAAIAVITFAIATAMVWWADRQERLFKNVNSDQ